MAAPVPEIMDTSWRFREYTRTRWTVKKVRGIPLSEENER
jgi:hypothetical protein